MRQTEPSAGAMHVMGSGATVPLVGVSVDFSGTGHVARVRVRQRFVNVETVPVEAVYTFPLEDGSAVSELVIETGGRRLTGRVEEREKAFEQYEEAIAEGHGAILLDQDRPNIFTVSVGSLLPGQEVTVCLGYVTELVQHGKDVRIMLPTTISPRYVPPKMRREADPVELERINPPTVIGPVPYGLSLTVDYVAAGGIEAVACPSHPARVELDGSRARVTLMGRDIQLDRDFVLNITLRAPFVPSALVAPDGAEHRALLLSFLPEALPAERTPQEYIFLLDRSGSMAGESIEQALDALRIALRSLEAGDTFNVIGFGSRPEMLFPRSQPYTQQSLEQASAALARWDADLGGTELLAPLRLALDAPHPLPCRIMLLTDGQVGNESACIAAVRRAPESVRVFTFGLGYGASESLVRGIARAGGGQAEFIHPAERIEPVVMRQFARAVWSEGQQLRLDWSGLLPYDWGAESLDLLVPRRPGALIPGERLTMVARVPLAHARRRGKVVLTVQQGKEQIHHFPLMVDLDEVATDSPVPQLMGRMAIRELEAQHESGSRSERDTQTAILELALRYGLLSSQTSFVAIEERAVSDDAPRPELRRVPVALTHGWGGLRGHAVDMASCDASLSMACLSLSPPDLDAMSDLSVSRDIKYSMMKSLTRDSSYDVVGCASESMDRSRIHRHRWHGTADDAAFMRLVNAQRADGSFRFDQVLLDDLGVDTRTLDRVLRELGTHADSETVAHTALALTLLMRRWPERRDEWHMLGEKALHWLAACGVAAPAGFASLLDWALDWPDGAALAG